MHTRGHPYKLFKSQSNTRVRSAFLANELLMLGTIYRVTLLTLQVSMHLEVVFNVWTSVITSCVTDNFFTYCLFLLVLVGYGYCQCISEPFSPVPSIHFSLYSLFVSLFGPNKVELSWVENSKLIILITEDELDLKKSKTFLPRSHTVIPTQFLPTPLV